MSIGFSPGPPPSYQPFPAAPKFNASASDASRNAGQTTAASQEQMSQPDIFAMILQKLLMEKMQEAGDAG